MIDFTGALVAWSDRRISAADTSAEKVIEILGQLTTKLWTERGLDWRDCDSGVEEGEEERL